MERKRGGCVIMLITVAILLVSLWIGVIVCIDYIIVPWSAKLFELPPEMRVKNDVSKPD